MDDIEKNAGAEDGGHRLPTAIGLPSQGLHAAPHLKPAGRTTSHADTDGQHGTELQRRFLRQRRRAVSVPGTHATLVDTVMVPYLRPVQWERSTRPDARSGSLRSVSPRRTLEWKWPFGEYPSVAFVVAGTYLCTMLLMYPIFWLIGATKSKDGTAEDDATFFGVYLLILKSLVVGGTIPRLLIRGTLDFLDLLAPPRLLRRWQADELLRLATRISVLLGMPMFSSFIVTTLISSPSCTSTLDMRTFIPPKTRADVRGLLQAWWSLAKMTCIIAYIIVKMFNKGIDIPSTLVVGLASGIWAVYEGLHAPCSVGTLLWYVFASWMFGALSAFTVRNWSQLRHRKNADALFDLIMYLVALAVVWRVPLREKCADASCR